MRVTVTKSPPVLPELSRGGETKPCSPPSQHRDTQKSCQFLSGIGCKWVIAPVGIEYVLPTSAWVANRSHVLPTRPTLKLNPISGCPDPRLCCPVLCISTINTGSALDTSREVTDSTMKTQITSLRDTPEAIHIQFLHSSPTVCPTLI